MVSFLTNTAHWVNACCLLGCHLRGVICRPIYHYIFSMPIGYVIIVFELEKQLGLLRSTLLWMAA